MTMTLDETGLAQVVLVVRFRDRTERWGPSRRDFAEMVKEALTEDPPEGFVSAHIEES